MLEYVEKVEPKSISLEGLWKYQLDQKDVGIVQKWYLTQLEFAGFKMPGTTCENGIGEPLEVEPVLSKDAVKCLRQNYKYVGAAWYQRTIVIPKTWKDKSVILFLERVIFQSRVWIDGNEIGKQDSLSVPHRFNLSNYVELGGIHTLTIRIDNRDVQNIGPHSSAYTDETQTIWNGIVGKVMLYIEEEIFLENIQVYPNISSKKVKFKSEIRNSLGKDIPINLTVFAQSTNTGRKHIAPAANFRFSATGDREIFENEYTLGSELLLWDEFSPAVYELDITITWEVNGQTKKSKKTVTFGMREFKTLGTQFVINNRKTFLRGTLDCCIYPLTGYPPTKVEQWLKVFRTIKDYGLNHLRFHSWCPPEAAFIAADDLGVYLQVEGPMWMDTWSNFTVGSHTDHYTYLPAEAERIIEAYGNHPSFCIFSNGNELNGDFKLLHDIVGKLKQKDTRHVYTLTSNWDRPLDAADECFIAQTVDGVGIRGQYFLEQMVESADLSFENAVSKRDVPVISHEVGQYCVYPNMDEIKKYTGVLTPINFEAIKRDLENRGMLDCAARFTFGSGKLALQLYKDDLEAALRTQGLGGIQLLDLHDFPGQSTATIGILDSFWESKGLVEPTQFRRFCSPTVLLVRMAKRIYENTEDFSASVEVAHFGAEALSEVVICWDLSDEKGNKMFAGTFLGIDIPIGNGIKVGTIGPVMLGEVIEASRLMLTISIENTDISNSWDIWVYPSADHQIEKEVDERDNILIASTFSSFVEKQLLDGKKVLLLPQDADVSETFPGKYFPVFWSPVHFVSKDPCGIYCNSTHEVFEKFPTDFYASYQWKDLLENSFSICLDGFPAVYSPIVEVIPNFFHNHRLGNMFEAKVGEGRLFVCSIDIETELEKRPAARQLRNSLFSYVTSNQFNPLQEVTIEVLKNMFMHEKLEEKSRRTNIALGKPASSDSIKSSIYKASKGNDGKDNTCWCAADANNGHWWQVDLEEISEINGTKVVFSEEENYLYVLQVSDDGVTWRLVVNQTGQVSKARERTDHFKEKARFVRIVYNGLPSGSWASHKEFEVYS